MLLLAGGWLMIRGCANNTNDDDNNDNARLDRRSKLQTSMQERDVTPLTFGSFTGRWVGEGVARLFDKEGVGKTPNPAMFPN